MSEPIQPDAKHRVNITLSDDAFQTLKRYSTPRKGGELISQLLVEYSRTINVMDVVAHLERRIEALESELVALKEKEGG